MCMLLTVGVEGWIGWGLQGQSEHLLLCCACLVAAGFGVVLGVVQLMSNTMPAWVGFSHLFVITLFEESSSGRYVRYVRLMKFSLCIYMYKWNLWFWNNFINAGARWTITSLSLSRSAQYLKNMMFMYYYHACNLLLSTVWKCFVFHLQSLNIMLMQLNIFSW